MSFVTGGLFLKESAAIASLHKPGESWDLLASRALEAGSFPVRKISSAKRSIREIIHRLSRLTDNEIEIFNDGDRVDQQALLWLAVCRTYRFVGEFAQEVLAERYQNFRTDLTYDDFDIFYARKEEWSPKLAGISEMTRAKLRAVMFRLMRESGMINSSDQIVGAILSTRFTALLERGEPQEFRFFPGMHAPQSGARA